MLSIKFNRYFYLVVIVLLFSARLSNAGDYKDLILMKYKLGDYDFIEKSRGDFSYLYKGFLREYMLVDEPPINAKKLYYKLSQPLSDYRIFMLCFLHCENELEGLYNNHVQEHSTAKFIYAIYAERSSFNCESMVLDKKLCAMTKLLFSKHKNSDDVYRSIANSLLDMSEDERLNELVYYLFAKSYLSGNEYASTDLASMHYWIKWVPRDCNKIKKLIGEVGIRKNNYNDCFENKEVSHGYN